MQAQNPASLTTDNTPEQLPMLLVYLMLLLAALKLGVQIWGANKGFDIWDEGLYVMMLNFFDQYPTEPHNYYCYVMDSIWPLQEFNLLQLRLLSIFTETFAISFFTYSLFQFFAYRPNAPFRFTLPAFPLLLFTFCGAAFLSVYARAFSYNDFSYFSTLSISGSLMLFFKNGTPLPKSSKALGLLLLFVIGGLLGAQLVVKFSTCLLLVGWVVIFVLFFSKQSNWYKTILIGALFLGAFTALLALFGSYDGFSTWMHNLNEGVALLRQLAYEPYYIIVRGYLYVDIVLNGIYFIGPLLVGFFVYNLLEKKHSANKTTRHIAAYASGIATWLLCSLTIHHGFLGEFYYRFIAVYIFSLLYWGIPVIRHLLTNRKWEWLLFLTMLAALPIMALLGSSNTATQTLTRYLASWLALIALFLGYHFKENIGAFVLIMAFLVSFSWVNYVTVQVYNPYGLNAPLTEQNTPVNDLHYLDGILLDVPSARFFEELKDATGQSGYHPGGPILALGDLCGTAMAMGGYIPETFWYFSDDNAISPEHSRNYSCMHLKNLRINEHKRLPLVFINSGINQQVIDCLANSEVPFPEGYHLKQTIFNPYAEESLAIWVPINWELPAK